MEVCSKADRSSDWDPPLASPFNASEVLVQADPQYSQRQLLRSAFGLDDTDIVDKRVLEALAHLLLCEEVVGSTRGESGVSCNVCVQLLRSLAASEQSINIPVETFLDWLFRAHPDSLNVPNRHVDEPMSSQPGAEAPSLWDLATIPSRSVSSLSTTIQSRYSDRPLLTAIKTRADLSIRQGACENRAGASMVRVDCKSLVDTPSCTGGTAAQWVDYCALTSTARTFSAEESDSLGVSVVYLETEFLVEAAGALRRDSGDYGLSRRESYRELAATMFCGPEGRGYGLQCPRDLREHCSFVDALDRIYTGGANVVVSWNSASSVQAVVGGLSKWCKKSCLNPSQTFVWQSILCNNLYRFQDRGQSFEQAWASFQRRACVVGRVLALVDQKCWRPDISIQAGRPRIDRLAGTYLGRVWCLMELYAAHDICRLDIELLPFTALDSGVVAPADSVHAERSSVDIECSLPHEVMAEGAGVDIKVERQFWNTLSHISLELAEGVASDCAAALRLVNAEILNERVTTWLRCSVAERVAGELVGGFLATGRCCPESCATVGWWLMEIQAWARAAEVLSIGLKSCETSRPLGVPTPRGDEPLITIATLLHSSAVCAGVQDRHEEALNFYDRAKSAYIVAGATGTAEYRCLLRSFAARLRTGGCRDKAGMLYREARDLSPRQSIQSLGELSSDETPLREASPFPTIVDEDLYEDTSVLSRWAPGETEFPVGCGSERSPSRKSSQGSVKAFLCLRRASSEFGNLNIRSLTATDSELEAYEELRARALSLGGRGSHEEAMECYIEAKYMLEKAGMVDTHEYKDLLKSMAARLRSRGLVDQAAALYRIVGVDHTSSTPIIDNLSHPRSDSALDFSATTFGCVEGCCDPERDCQFATEVAGSLNAADISQPMSGYEGQLSDSFLTVSSGLHSMCNSRSNLHLVSTLQDALEEENPIRLRGVAGPSMPTEWVSEVHPEDSPSDCGSGLDLPASRTQSKSEGDVARVACMASAIAALKQHITAGDLFHDLLKLTNTGVGHEGQNSPLS